MEKQSNIQFENWEEFYEYCKPERLTIQYRNVISIKQSLMIKRMTIGEITLKFGSFNHKIYGEISTGILYYVEWLSYLNNIINMPKSLNMEKIMQLSFMIYPRYYYFYMSDLKLILEGILESKYGKFYGSVDSQLIMTAFSEYAKNRHQIEHEMK